MPVMRTLTSAAVAVAGFLCGPAGITVATSRPVPRCGRQSTAPG